MFCDEHGTQDYCGECMAEESDKRIAELEQALKECMYDKSISRNTELKAENAKLREAINEHNKEKEQQCAMNNHDGSCNPYIARGRKCPNCPMDDRIEALKETQ